MDTEESAEASYAASKSSHTVQDVVQVIPNPSNGNIEVTIPGDFVGTAIILNAMGQRISATKVEKEKRSIIFHLEHQATGVYWLILSDMTGRTIASNKFAVIH